MHQRWKTETRACAYCGASFKPVRRCQRFCSYTNHRYLHHARIKPRIRRRYTLKIQDRVEIEIERSARPGDKPSSTTLSSA